MPRAMGSGTGCAGSGTSFKAGTEVEGLGVRALSLLRLEDCRVAIGAAPGADEGRRLGRRVVAGPKAGGHREHGVGGLVLAELQGRPG